MSDVTTAYQRCDFVHIYTSQQLIVQNVTGTCAVHVVTGDHDGIVQGEHFMTTSKLITDILERHGKDA